MAVPLHKNPCSGDHKIYSCERHFLGYHYYAFCLYEFCIRAKKKLLKRDAISSNDLYGHKLARNPCPRGHTFYNLVAPSLVIITAYLLCVSYASEKRRRF